MKSKYLVVAIALVMTQLISVDCFVWGIVRIATKVIGKIVETAGKQKKWVVEVHNEGIHDAHMWCASKDNRIGPTEGLWVKPGDKIVWAFHKMLKTQFWCTMDWHGQRVGWDVFVASWKDAPNPTIWFIKNDGVYDQWKNRKWRNLNS